MQGCVIYVEALSHEIKPIAVFIKIGMKIRFVRKNGERALKARN